MVAARAENHDTKGKIIVGTDSRVFVVVGFARIPGSAPRPTQTLVKGVLGEIDYGVVWRDGTLNGFWDESGMTWKESECAFGGSTQGLSRFQIDR